LIARHQYFEFAFRAHGFEYLLAIITSAGVFTQTYLPRRTRPPTHFNAIFINSIKRVRKLREREEFRSFWRLMGERNFFPLQIEFLFVNVLPVCNELAKSHRARTSNSIPKEIAMNFQKHPISLLWRSGFALAAICLTTTLTAAGQWESGALVITSTNNASGNAVEVFKLNTSGTPSLTLAQTLNTGGKGGASTNAGILQFKDGLGAVANYGSSTVSQLVRNGNSVSIGKTIYLAPECVNPDSVALTRDHLFVVGANCAESHAWPWGNVDGPVVSLTNPSAAQIAVGESWAAVTMSSGSLLQLPLNYEGGVLNGTSTAILLPTNADMVPLGEAFWGDVLGFTPAHSPDSFAIVDEDQTLTPIAGPTPSYPVNAPCWVAKGPGNIWYTGNSPGHAISIFFSDGEGGVFYKSVPLPGSPTDITVSADRKWLAVIYTAGGDAYVSVFAIDGHGDLTLEATSSAIGVASFNGVAISL
jgi:hypothetical protein